MSGKSRRRRRKRKGCLSKLILLLVLAVAVIIFYRLFAEKIFAPPLDLDDLAGIAPPDYVNVQIIDTDGSSRSGDKLEAVRDIVVHYVGNPGTTAQQNRDFFSNPDSEVSSHFVVGMDGEVIQCVPLNEESSASNWRNIDTISIEVCHPDATGEFTEATYESLVKLTAFLCETYRLKKDNIIRHFDITGKQCPLFYVTHEDEWLQFKEDVDDYDT